MTEAELRQCSLTPGLAVDYHNERLYWADAKLSVIGSIRLNGTDPIVAADSKRGERALAALVPNIVIGLPTEPRDLTSVLTCFRSPAPSQPVGLRPMRSSCVGSAGVEEFGK